MSIPAEMFTFDPKVSEVGQIGGKRMSSETTNIENRGKGDGKKKLIIAIVAVVFCVLIIAVTAMAALLVKTNREKQAAQKPEQKPKEVITAENVDEVLAEMEEDQESRKNIPQSYTVSQNSDWEFSADTLETKNAYVKNDQSNETPIYFDLVVDNTEEIVYSSPVLELGAELRGFKLDKPLKAGTYVCTVVYHLVDEEQNELTHVNIGVNVTVN